MAIDKSDPFPGLPRPNLFGPSKRAVTEPVQPLPKSVTEKPSVTELRETVAALPSVKPKRGRKPSGDRPLTASEKQRRYRERQKAKT